MKLNDAEKNAFEALTYVIESTGMKVTSQSVKEQLYLHPDFPSLLSFSDALKKWNVPNIATRVFREQLVEIPLPAVAYLEIKGGYFAPIRNASSEGVEWLDTNTGWQKDSLEEFYRKWNHVVLLLEPNQNAAEAKYEEKRKEALLKNARVPFIIIGLAVCLACWGLLNKASFATLDWPYFALLLTKLTGIAISILLLMHGLNSDNTILRSICGFDSRTDCNNILTSNAAKLWGWLSWSDIGFVYFTGGFIYLLSPQTLRGSAPDGGANYLLPLWWLGTLALPYTIWSVWYQWRIAKTWCTLCLIVQVLIWVEFIITFGLNGLLSEWRISELNKAPIGGLGAFLLPAVLLVFIKKPMQEATQVWPLKRELQKSKFNPEYVESLFAKQPQMPPIFEDMRVVQMGNATAEHTLTVVTNPMCGPCMRLHPEIEALLQKNDALNCQFVFAGAGPAMAVAERLLSLPDAQAAEAMHQWYTSKNKNVEEWTKTVNADKGEATSAHQLSIHADWCKMAEIMATPTIYLNGRQMPLAYKLDDVETLCRILVPNGTLT